MDQVTAFILQFLTPLAGSAVASILLFVGLVGLDNVAGGFTAWVKHAWDWHKLPSWLVSQFGTKQLLVAFVAFMTAEKAAPTPATKEALLALAAAGVWLLIPGLVADIVAKVKYLFGLQSSWAPTKATRPA